MFYETKQVCICVKKIGLPSPMFAEIGTIAYICRIIFSDFDIYEIDL